ncbi:MAG: hypothetical protein Q9M36_11885 [Sulfurovum sp.]|nr:hypothetical protein [Sulfurovum sp.]
MKHILWVGIIALVMQVEASENPFDLQTNFGNLEYEQDLLLSGLKKHEDKSVKQETPQRQTPQRNSTQKSKKPIPEVQIALLEALIEDESTSAKTRIIPLEPESKAITRAKEKVEKETETKRLAKEKVEARKAEKERIAQDKADKKAESEAVQAKRRSQRPKKAKKKE